MRGIFDYDSKFMQFLMKFADIAILNVLFLICSIPIFTIGAAQAGLYTGFRVMLDPEDESSPSAAFFRGFRNGFWVITPVWLILTLVVGVVAYSCATTYYLHAAGMNAPVVLSVIALIVVTIFQNLVPIFHSRFSCKRWQLVKNCWYLLLAHPIRSILSVLLFCAPVLIFLLNVYVFMQMFIIFLSIWYGFAGIFTVSLMKKPFRTLEERYYELQEEAEFAKESDLEEMAEYMQMREITQEEMHQEETELSDIAMSSLPD